MKVTVNEFDNFSRLDIYLYNGDTILDSRCGIRNYDVAESYISSLFYNYSLDTSTLIEDNVFNGAKIESVELMTIGEFLELEEIDND